jgi:hypothetical protein
MLPNVKNNDYPNIDIGFTWSFVRKLFYIMLYSFVQSSTMGLAYIYISTVTLNMFDSLRKNNLRFDFLRKYIFFPFFKNNFHKLLCCFEEIPEK